MSTAGGANWTALDGTADEITVTAGSTPSGGGAPVFSDNAESPDAGWTSNGFSRIGASFTKESYERT